MAEAKVERAVRLTMNCDWAELGAMEHEGSLLWPENLERRRADGSLEQVPIMLRPVQNGQRFQARTRSRKWAGELGLDLDRDKDLVEELENYECLAFAIRDREPPHVQHMKDGKMLFGTYLAASLAALWSKLGALSEVMDPRYGDLDGEEMWDVIYEVARRGQPTPLVRMRGFEQATCIVLMAKAACSSPSAPSSIHSRWTSALEISRRSSSEPSAPSPEEATESPPKEADD